MPAKSILVESPKTSNLKIRDWVRVRSPQEIEETLTNGRLEGLPFMPEMASYCERDFRVKRFATKVCVNDEQIDICSLENCVILQTKERCDGRSHGDCDMGCEFIWKLDWLIKLEKPPEHGSENSGLENSQSSIPPNFFERLVQIAGPIVDPEERNSDEGQRSPSLASKSKYCCQATELVRATNRLSPLQFKQYVSDSRLNDVPTSSICKFIASVLVKKITKTSDSLAGPCLGRTPPSNPLSVGDRVLVKSVEEIRQTLDQNGCNRGLWFDPKEMASFCGKELVVSREINRLIDERTGELKILKTPSYVLSETYCSGVFRRFCTRGMLHFWREVWLTKLS